MCRIRGAKTTSPGFCSCSSALDTFFLSVGVQCSSIHAVVKFNSVFDDAEFKKLGADLWSNIIVFFVCT